MTKNALAELEPDAQTAKRAQYEAFTFDLEAPGLVRVTNGSYGEEADDHSYLVNVENGVPTACECLAFEYQPGPCKHMVAVAIREPVLEAATAEVATDGGERTTGSRSSSDRRSDGGQVVETDSDVDADAATGCPHDHPTCEGVDADRERPELCFECWEEWAAYDPADHLADADVETDR